MCDFHSTAWRLLGQEVQMCHLPNNSHGEMIEAAGWRVNQPNRQPVIFEAEWGGSGEFPPHGRLVRNSGECPEKLMAAIRTHYTKLEAALREGKHFTDYFGDVVKWADVWQEAMQGGVMPDFSNITHFHGSVDVRQGATFTAPALTKSGSVYVQQGATFTAPALTEVSGYVDVQQGATFTAPALTEVSGSVYVQQGATFTAPALTKSGSVYVQQGATFTAPKLKRK